MNMPLCVEILASWVVKRSGRMLLQTKEFVLQYSVRMLQFDFGERYFKHSGRIKIASVKFPIFLYFSTLNHSWWESTLFIKPAVLTQRRLQL